MTVRDKLSGINQDLKRIEGLFSQGSFKIAKSYLQDAQSAVDTALAYGEETSELDRIWEEI